MGISNNNKRIAVNTLFLYGRMLFCMFVSFFTTRIVLQALGVVDYGLVNAIGGIVGMFVFVSIPLTSACSRFFSYDLGRNDLDGLKKTFSTMLILYVLMAFFILGVLELVGLWYLEHKLVLPIERIGAARIFFQLTVATLILNFFSIPYSSMIVSFENMALYSWLSIFDYVMKLAVASMVLFVKELDGLILYGALWMVAVGVHTFLNYYFATRNYPVCKFRWYYDKTMLEKIFAFNCWQMVGSFAWTSSEMFVGLLLNSFFGPVVNAARGVSAQVMNGVFGFTQSFLTAVRPQIVKLWAAHDIDGFFNLIRRASKIGYFLVLFVALPLLFELDLVLDFWLRNVPEYAGVFAKLVLITALINTFAHPIVYAAQAVGKIALFESLGSGVRILVWPTSWLVLTFGYGPASAFYVGLFITAISLLLRLSILIRLTGISACRYISDVFGRMILVTVVSAAIVFVPHYLIEEHAIRFLAVGFTSAFTVSTVFAFIGLTKVERISAVNLIKDKMAAKLKRTFSNG